MNQTKSTNMIHNANVYGNYISCKINHFLYKLELIWNFIKKELLGNLF